MLVILCSSPNGPLLEMHILGDLLTCYPHTQYKDYSGVSINAILQIYRYDNKYVFNKLECFKIFLNTMFTFYPCRLGGLIAPSGVCAQKGFTCASKHSCHYSWYYFSSSFIHKPPFWVYKLIKGAMCAQREATGVACAELHALLYSRPGDAISCNIAV